MSMEKTALLFSGQGAQEAGMGRDLAERDADIMNMWKKAEKVSGIALRGIYWEGGENLDDTSRLQPALTVMNLSLWMELSKKLSPAATAGHSLGEYCALAAASVLSIDKVIELVTLRGRLMAEADPDGNGAMAAMVKLDLQKAEEVVAQVLAEMPGVELRIANYNTPTQFVASGAKKAIELLVEKARDFKGRGIPLAVSGAFHSPLMAEAAKEMAVAINKCDFGNPRFPVYCNVSGKASSNGAEVKDLLLKQMTSSVQWINTVTSQFNDGMRLFVECSPKNVLAKMVGQILAPVAEEGAYKAITVSGPEDLAAFGK